MNVKIILSIILSITSAGLLAQQHRYEHCNCLETLTDSAYRVVAGDIELEYGQFANGQRDGRWESKDRNGVTIRKANYVNGKLNGSYELFHFGGQPKLIASFEHGMPRGQWTYYNDKGKIIKQGRYTENKPDGVWRIHDKRGKNILVEFDYSTNSQIINAKGKRYFPKGGIIRDAQSGEWMMLYFPFREIALTQQPLGGYLLANDIFVLNVTIPPMLMDTYNTFECSAKIRFENGSGTVQEVKVLDRAARFDQKGHSLSFMVSTNRSSKLSEQTMTQATLDFLTAQLAEFLMTAGPWSGVEDGNTIDLRIPFVLNNVGRE